MTTLTIELPDELAAEARNRGLLVRDAVEATIRERLRASAATELLEAADQLAAAEFPSLTMVEIQEEVKAVRRKGADERRCLTRMLWRGRWSWRWIRGLPVLRIVHGPGVENDGVASHAPDIDDDTPA